MRSRDQECSARCGTLLQRSTGRYGLDEFAKEASCFFPRPPLTLTTLSLSVLSHRLFSIPAKTQEPLVLSLLASHAALLMLTVATRKNQTVQLAILALCFALVRGGEKLNALAADLFRRASSSSSSSSPPHHPRRTNYFDDESGVFWSALVSTPLLLVMATQLASLFMFSSSSSSFCPPFLSVSLFPRFFFFLLSLTALLAL